jgi:hypothetical protein
MSTNNNSITFSEGFDKAKNFGQTDTELAFFYF